jgi:ABC-type transporter MlaC component
LDQNEKALEDFLYKNALPFWDTRLMARGLGGKEYRKASATIKQDLEEQWKLTLIRYFLKAFPYYHKQRLELEKTMNCPAKNRCWLRTTIEIAGKQGVELDFYLRWNKPKTGKNKWQVIDMRVAGVSLLKHKRGETRGVLHAQGIDGLIKALKNKNSELSLAAIGPGA